jgi:hypothetical protein|tara:strand:+ start:222 stop:572 length:351 start_codon:yes stop_codon:yes gene_type:complete
MRRYTYNNEHIKVGDIFYRSWGYDQTNIDYYVVTKKIGKASAMFAYLENRKLDEKSDTYHDAVVPYLPSQHLSKQFLCRIKYYRDSKDPSININSYSNAYLWDGTPKMQTNPYYGH